MAYAKKRQKRNNKKYKERYSDARKTPPLLPHLLNKTDDATPCRHQKQSTQRALRLIFDTSYRDNVADVNFAASPAAA